MTTQATLAYTAFLGGMMAADAAALVAAVPLPQGLLDFYGVRVLSDATPGASPVVRTIVLGFNPVSSATATAQLHDHGDSGSGLKGLTVTAAGSGYVQPPVVSFTGGRTGPAPTEISGDENTPPSAVAYLKVVSAAVLAGGSGYTAATRIVVTGKLKSSGGPPPFSAGAPLPPDVGVVAVLTPTIAIGVITGVVVTSAGSGYVGVPTVTVVDSGGGTGASVSVNMGVGALDLLRPGGGFSSAPSVVLTPYFQALFPAGTSPHVTQQAPFLNLFTAIFEKALLSPIAASTPVIA